MKDERKTSFEDELIDRALAHRRIEEPRAGLEERLLARLDTATAPRRGWLFKSLAVAVPAAAALLLAVWVVGDGFVTRRVQPVQPPEPRGTIAEAPSIRTQPESEALEEPPVVSAPTAQPEPGEPAPAPVQVRVAAHRSPTFPSPATLSRQEELLLRFVRLAPRATLHSLAAEPQPAPLHIDELSVPRLDIEPLPAPDPLYSAG